MPEQQYTTLGTIHPNEAMDLVLAGAFSVRQALRHLKESGLFMQNEMEEAEKADFKSITTGSHLLTIVWWNKDDKAEDRRSISFDVSALAGSTDIPEKWPE
jgi:hypothetical protein